MKPRPLRFHWSLSAAGDKFRRAQATVKMSGRPDLESQIELCCRAELSGIESMLMAIGFTRPDPTLLSVAIGLQTGQIKFMIACRAGLISPTAFVQQINTASALLNGRICINMVCGHTPHELRYYGDFLEHDERYDRTDEFLAVCREYWKGTDEVNFSGRHLRIEKGRLNSRFVSPEGGSPEIFLGGNSSKAAALAIKHAACLWRFPDTPKRLAEEIKPVLEQGKEVGLLVSLIARPDRSAAHQAAQELIAGFGADTRNAHVDFTSRSDSVGFRTTSRLAGEGESPWLTPCLWTGAVPYLGAPAIALVGSAADVAGALIEYQRMGITQFLFMGWPDIDEMTFFGREVLPLVRSVEESEPRLQIQQYGQA